MSDIDTRERPALKTLASRPVRWVLARKRWGLAFGATCALVIGSASLLLGVRVSEKVHHELLAAQMTRTTFEGGYWDLFHYDADLGSSAVPGAGKRVAKKLDGQLVYDVVYTIDAKGRRKTPQPGAPDEGGQALVFFGGSYAFGEGLDDDEILPSYAAALAPGYKVFNYGCLGYGPQQMLAMLERGELADDINAHACRLVYVFNSCHFRRAIGSLRVASSWGRCLPCYVLDGDQRLVRKGSFESGRPRRAELYKYFGAFETLWYWNVDWPLCLSGKHIEVTGRIIEESRNRLEGLFDSTGFHVLLYPDSPDAEVSAHRIIPHLTGAGIDYLDYTGLVDMADSQYAIPGDGHPTAMANETVASRLIHDLSL